MLAPTILTALFNTPPTHVAPPDFADRIDTVDVSVSDLDAVLTAHDADGEPIGSLALWVDDGGMTWIAVDFADGYAVIAIAPDLGEVHRDATLESAVVAERVDAMLAGLDGPESRSWGECAWKAGGAAIGCFMARPIACVGGSIKAACACVPKLVEEFEGYKCPWGL